MAKLIDLTNEKFGRLTVLREVDRVKSRRRWLCKCECGNETIVYQSNLRGHHTKSCGCLVDDFSAYAKEAFAEDLTNRVFGDLTVLKRADGKRASWLCQCTCGKQSIVTANNLRNGHTVSCGCRKVGVIEQIRQGTDAAMRVDDVLVHTLTRKTSTLNKTGTKGVSITQDRQGNIKFRVSITLKKKRINLGTYANLDDAIQARKNGEALYHKSYIDKLEGKNNDD